MLTTYQFFEQAKEWLQPFNEWALMRSPIARADHLCFKCDNSANFEHIRRLFEADSSFIYQSIISGRRIAIIHFSEPIETALGPIQVLELSDQKPDGSQKKGFDHVEIFPIDGRSLEELVMELEKAGDKLKKIVRPHHTTYDISNILGSNMKVRLEAEPLIKTIKREMRD